MLHSLFHYYFCCTCAVNIEKVFNPSSYAKVDDARENSDVTFRVDDFSYKKVFNPSSYAKVMPILLNSREILQIKSKFIFVNFRNN